MARARSPGMPAWKGKSLIRLVSGTLRSMASVRVSVPTAVVSMAALMPGGTMMGILARPEASACTGPKSRSPTLSIRLELGVEVTG